MPKIDERHKALMTAYLSLDRRNIVIKNEGNCIARDVQIFIEHSPEDPPLLEEAPTKAEINYMPLSHIQLATTKNSKGLYKITLYWTDDSATQNQQIHRIFK